MWLQSIAFTLIPDFKISNDKSDMLYSVYN